MATRTAIHPQLVEQNTARPIGRYLLTGSRVSMGLLFFVCGLNGFLNFLPQPSDPMPERAMTFAVALMTSGYMMPLIAATQAVAGALLLSNRCVAFALVLLAPVIVNIFAFHAFLAPSGLGIAIVLVVIEACLAWAHRDAYRPLFAARVNPKNA